MKDLLGNKIDAGKPKAKPVRRASPRVHASVNMPEIVNFRPYRSVRESPTKVWVVNQ